ncbi:hypothetical protein E2C01_007515 [Portunus trituberculatus]|uniref:Uncharacterized protein n=1 Tax=Portunus trituberculatus TaxID=210409 RepID=A0A5B7D1D5_PORTR|nr:hypothetical protein [Portunus trituberculatus]
MPLETKAQRRESQGPIDAMARKSACPTILESVRAVWLASVPKFCIRLQHTQYTSFNTLSYHYSTATPQNHYKPRFHLRPVVVAVAAWPTGTRPHQLDEGLQHSSADTWMRCRPAPSTQKRLPPHTTTTGVDVI